MKNDSKFSALVGIVTVLLIALLERSGVLPSGAADALFAAATVALGSAAAVRRLRGERSLHAELLAGGLAYGLLLIITVVPLFASDSAFRSVVIVASVLFAVLALSASRLADGVRELLLFATGTVIALTISIGLVDLAALEVAAVLFAINASKREQLFGGALIAAVVSAERLILGTTRERFDVSLFTAATIVFTTVAILYALAYDWKSYASDTLARIDVRAHPGELYKQTFTEVRSQAGESLAYTAQQEQRS